MADIVLATLNAKFIHAAFGLRYLLANLGPLQSRAALLEFDINQKPIDIAEAILAQNPRIVGLGVYIWNVHPSQEVVTILKRIRPDLFVILGGPEVSYETDQQKIARQADYLITGEADLQFATLANDLLAGRIPPQRILPAPLPDMAKLALPYHLYDDRDIAHRIIYVEASRGCPFTCEFCLSSLDIPVRQFPQTEFLSALEQLLDRGVQQFKFVDRTFNLNLQTGRAILEFFLKRYRPGLFLHFEMIPDRLPEAFRDLIKRFPPGALQFEVGIQTFNPEVAARIKRRQNYEKLTENLTFLREQTGVHVHADLIAGLPGEDLESFGRGFDHLLALKPQEIQVGILKRLRGTPIVRHDAEWNMIYNTQAPYELLQNRSITFSQMQQLRRFSKYWDLLANSGNFIETAPWIWHSTPSAFNAFMRCTEWLYQRTGRSHSIPLVHLAEFLFEYLTQMLQLEPAHVAQSLWRDYQRGGRSDKPPFLRPFLPVDSAPALPASRRSLAPKRQARHLG